MAKKPKPTPDPYFMDGFPPAEGFGGYDSKTNKLVPMNTTRPGPRETKIGPTVTMSTGQGLRSRVTARVKTKGTRRGGK